MPISGVVPDPADAPDPQRKAAMQRSLDYMGLTPGTKMEDVTIDKVFVGSCTNGRIEDIRAVAAVAKGKKVADGVYAMVSSNICNTHTYTTVCFGGDPTVHPRDANPPRGSRVRTTRSPPKLDTGRFTIGTGFSSDTTIPSSRPLFQT